MWFPANFYSPKDLLLANLLITPLVHSAGISSFSQFKKRIKFVGSVFGIYFYELSSYVVDSWSFVVFAPISAALVSSFLIGSVDISPISSTGTSRSGTMVSGGSHFSTSWKCSAHLFSLLTFEESRLPDLSFIVISWLWVCLWVGILCHQWLDRWTHMQNSTNNSRFWFLVPNPLRSNCWALAEHCISYFWNQSSYYLILLVKGIKFGLHHNSQPPRSFRPAAEQTTLRILVPKVFSVFSKRRLLSCW